MADLATLFIKVDSQGVVTASRDLDNLTGKSKKTETATEGVTKSFSKLRAVVIALASSYALLKMAQYIKDATLLAARYETLGVVMRVVGNNAGYSGAQMDEFARGLQKAGIAMVESRNTLARMIQAQIDLTSSQKLARIAQDAAVIGNINSSETFERMIYGLQTGMPRILKTIGLNVDFDASVRALAISLGIKKDALSEAQIMQGRVNAVTKAGILIEGTYEAAMGTAGKQLLSLTRHFDNLKVLLGAVFTPALTEIIETITGEIKDLNNDLEKNKEKWEEWGNNIRLVIIKAEIELEALLSGIDRVKIGIAAIGLLYAGPGALIGKIPGLEDAGSHFEYFADMMIGATDSTKKHMVEIDRLAAKYDALVKAMTPAGKLAAKQAEDAAEAIRIAAAKVARAEKDKADAIALAAERIKKAREEINKILIENVYELQSIGKSQYEQDLIQIQKSVQAFRDAGAEKIDIARFVASETGIATANEANRQAEETRKEADRQAEEIKKAAQDRLDMQTDFNAQYAAIGKSRFDLEKEAILAQGEVWKEAGFEQIKIKEWTDAEIRKLEENKISGVKAGLEEYVRTSGDIYSNIEDLTFDSLNRMEDALVDFCMTGKLNFKDFAKAIIKDLIRMAMQALITKAIMAGISGAFGGGGADTSGAAATSATTAPPAAAATSLTYAAQGGVFNSPNLSAHSNTIVDSPTLFSFAQGAGVYGEAGPEAIMPLTRLPGGDLGVKTESGGESKRPMEIHIHEASGTQTRTEESEDGTRLDIIIEQVEQAMTGRMERGTGMSPFMDGRYGRAY